MLLLGTQRALLAGAGLGPRLLNGAVWLRADDGLYYKVGLVEGAGWTEYYVEQTASWAPAGTDTLVMRSTDLANHELTLEWQNGVLVLVLNQAAASGTGLSELRLKADDGKWYTVTLETVLGWTQVVVGQVAI